MTDAGTTGAAAAGPRPEELADEVDEVVSAWARERPDLDLGPLEVLSRVTRLARHLDRARRSAFSDHELELSEFDVLAALRRAGEPYVLSPSQLTSQTLVTSGTMTNRIDRLSGKQLVERLPDPSDGRGVQVRLTQAGRERVDAAMADLLEREERLLAALSPPERANLAALLRTVVAPFDQPR